MKRPLRVLYVLNAPGGGATQGILEMLRGFPAGEIEAYAVTPVAPNDQQVKAFGLIFKEVQTIPMAWWNRKVALPLFWRPIVKGREMWQTQGRTRTVRALMQLIRRWQIDLVHTTTSLTVEGALAAHLSHVPHIWHIKEYIGRQGRVKFGLPDAWLTRFFNATADRVLVMTHFIGGIFVQERQTRKLAVVYDGVNTADFRGDLKGSALRHALSVPDEALLVGMVASLSAVWKQHELFIQMAALLSDRFPSVRFALFGAAPRKMANPAYNGKWHYYQALRQQVEALGLEKQFIWAGFVTNIPQLMDALDILVHPCDIEPFGRVAIEAMAAGRSVVGPDRGGIAESVVSGETGLLASAGSPEAFAEMTGRLIADAGLRRQMGVAGQVRATEVFSLAQHVAQMQAIYHEACAHVGRQATGAIDVA